LLARHSPSVGKLEASETPSGYNGGQMMTPYAIESKWPKQPGPFRWDHVASSDQQEKGNERPPVGTGRLSGRPSLCRPDGTAADLPTGGYSSDLRAAFNETQKEPFLPFLSGHPSARRFGWDDRWCPRQFACWTRKSLQAETIKSAGHFGWPKMERINRCNCGRRDGRRSQPPAQIGSHREADTSRRQKTTQRKRGAGGAGGGGNDPTGNWGA